MNPGAAVVSAALFCTPQALDMNTQQAKIAAPSFLNASGGVPRIGGQNEKP